MTCILACVDHNSNIHIGGDSISLSGWSKQKIDGYKVFRAGEMIFGFAGSPRLAQIIRWYIGWEPGQEVFQGQQPDQPLRNMGGFMMSNEEFLVTRFIPAAQSALETAEYDWSDEDARNSAFILGFRSHLYVVTYPWVLNPVGDETVGLGSASEYAVGALTAMTGSEMSIQDKMMRALEIAGRFSAAACPPYYVLSLPSNQ